MGHARTAKLPEVVALLEEAASRAADKAAEVLTLPLTPTTTLT